jgi:hypothetical protein
MGFVEDLDNARAEAFSIMRATAQSGATITYSGLVKDIKALDLPPDSEVLARLLDDISRAENEAGRGMLSAVVVHADDGLPCDGFYKLAKQLGRSVGDRAVFHATELAAVLAANK